MRMTIQRAAVSLTALSLALVGSSAEAEVLTPRSVEYGFVPKHDATGATCNVVMAISNYPEPEVVVFRYETVIAKAPFFVAQSFEVDVSDQQYRNGAPAELNPARLRSAEFISQNFSSAGRMSGGPIGDASGGVQMNTTDPAATLAFQRAFLSGHFVVQFTRENNPNPRGYAINERPPVEVLKKWLACVDEFTPR